MSGKWIKEHALGLVIFGLYALSHVGQFLTHDEDATKFWNATFENWQSEFLQIGVFIVVSAYLIYKGSPQSKDSDKEVKFMLMRVEQRLKDIEEHLKRSRSYPATGMFP